MNSRLGISLCALLAFASAEASTVTGRLEALQGREPLALRASVKPVVDLARGRFRIHAEGLLEADAYERLPYADRDRGRVLFEEAYVEVDVSPFTIRLGLQPLRWSESWSVPSLDFWTARRWDRYFLDPLPEQLKHPVGALVRYASRDIEVEAFASARTPQDSLPGGLGETEEEWRAEGGARAKLRLQGWDFSPVYAFARRVQNYGFSLSYAFDAAVAKFEVGRNDEEAFFVIGGADFFLGEWTLLPQLSFYRLTPRAETERILYLPLRYEVGRNKWEFQLLTTESGEIFWGSEFARSLNDTLGLSVFLQDYQGQGGGLISSFDTQVGAGWVTGLRLSATL
jgi:hypothetical protein